MKPPIHDTAAEKLWRCSFFGKVSERSVEIYCGFRFRPPLYSTAILNLNCSLLFSSTLSFCTFLKKYQKQGSRVRHSVLKVDNIAFSHPVRCKLCLHCDDYMLSMLSICRANSRVALQHLSVGAHLAARCLSQCLGWQELAALKHHATCFQALLGCSLCLPTLPIR